MTDKPKLGIMKCDYDNIRNEFMRMRATTAPVYWDQMADFARWSIDNGYKYGKRIRRINTNKAWRPDNCEWVDKQISEATRLAHNALAKRWNEFVAPIRERYRDELEQEPEKNAAPAVIKTGREVWRYEHPDLVREGIVFESSSGL